MCKKDYLQGEDISEENIEIGLEMCTYSENGIC